MTCRLCSSSNSNNLAYLARIGHKCEGPVPRTEIPILPACELCGRVSADLVSYPETEDHGVYWLCPPDDKYIAGCPNL